MHCWSASSPAARSGSFVCVKSGRAMPNGRWSRHAAASTFSIRAFVRSDGSFAPCASMHAVNAVIVWPTAASGLWCRLVRSMTTATMPITTGINVPNTSFGVDTGFGAFGGGVGHHDGFVKSPTLPVIVTVAAARWRRRSAATSIRNTVAMRLALTAAVAAAACAAASASAAHSLVLTVKTTQGSTVAHPHPPAGGVGDTYESSLVLRNAGVARLGKGPHATLGTMRFAYTIRHQCSSFSHACSASADFRTVTRLPGGTVSAGGNGISIATPEIAIPVTGGTGRYRGATGTVTISPAAEKLSTYRLRLP